LKNLNAGQYHFILKAKERLILSPGTSRILVEEFRKVFMKLYCVYKKETDCSRGCVFMDKCPYAVLFEAYTPPEKETPHWLEDLPLPFVLEPLWGEKVLCLPEESFEFKLILIGKGVEYLPYFILAVKELGIVGLGKEPNHFDLVKIFDSDREMIYTRDSDTIRSGKAVKHCINPEDYYSRNELTLRFLTPTRIHYQEKLVIQPEFYVLVREMIRRMEVLSFLYKHKKIDWDKISMISQAKKITIKMSSLEWTDLESESPDEGQGIKLGGFTGEIVYTGDFHPFFPLLLTGQEVHIGEHCTLGLGKYEMKTLM
jgi:hypothetical protein